MYLFQESLMLFSRRIQTGLAIFAIGLIPLSAYAEALNQAIQTEMATTKSAVKSQKKIDGLSDQTRKMLEEYRSAIRETETLNAYNKYLQDLINSQQKEKISLTKQLEDIEITQREIVPLVMHMLDGLENFIKLDLPFLPEERTQRLEILKEMLARADVTNAEKYRRILEAYQIENDYGNTIEAYRSDLNLNGTETEVDFLRLGRVAIYYQRLDGSESGFWNKASKNWESLPLNYSNSIRKGLRIARKEAAPDLLTLPVPAAEAAK
jgi:hypothetical protein